MSNLDHGRRSFLAGAGGTALVLTFHLPVKQSLAEPSQASFAPNAFLRVSAAGEVTAVLPKTEMGQGVYTAVPMMLAEELEVDPAAIKVEIPPAEKGRFAPVGQSTGGSSSVRMTWEPLRQAGANARELLIAAAAAKWGVAASDCQALGGQVSHLPSGRRFGYGELVAAAARLTLPAPVKLKSHDQFKVIGKSQRRLDGAGKVDGSAVFGIDVRPEGLKFAVIVICPQIGGSLKSIDEAAALQAPGVRQVVRLDDAFAVVADHTWGAWQGSEAASPVWADGPNANLNQEEVRKGLERAIAGEAVEALRRGDPLSAMASASRVVEAQYEQPFLAHATMEPTNCTVHIRKGSCDVWLGTQVPEAARDAAAKAAGVPVESVALHNFLLGGGFGRRLETDMVERAVAVGRVVAGPVQVIWTREEDIRQDLYRPYYIDRLVAGLDGAGEPVAWSHKVAGSSIMARLYPSAFKGVDVDAVHGSVDQPYRTPNALVGFARQESAVRTGWWRGVGPLRSLFAVESFIDELAHATKSDPLAYRLGLLDDARAKAVLTRVADEVGWRRGPPPGRSRGVALLRAWETYMAQIVEIEVDEDGLPIVRKVTVAIDCGQVINPDGVRAQVEGGVIFGLSAALHGEITFDQGRVTQSNFHDYRVLRMAEAPVVETHILPSTARPGGVGEPPTATVGPALANAVYAATGKRVRKLPIMAALQT